MSLWQKLGIEKAKRAGCRFHATPHFNGPVIASVLVAISAIVGFGSVSLKVSAEETPEGMVFVAGGKFHYIQVNRWREGLELNRYQEGPVGDAYVEDAWIDLSDFYIDKTEVTNAQYKRFLDAGGYRPKWDGNFLKHWSGGSFPPILTDHPVVYVDYWDAKAYAEWAGKQLPSEAQWQYAAQGLDGRLFPWGDVWNPAKANVGNDGTKPVGSYPSGASPLGILDLVGNVAEMTESLQDDGWHWFSYLRGGSWYQSSKSLWYAENGLLTNQQRLKFWWLNPEFNRSPAIGFRCVKSARQALIPQNGGTHRVRSNPK
jgi:gamma-glutamyl hercynylcysteine S-oxide synthase